MAFTHTDESMDFDRNDHLSRSIIVAAHPDDEVLWFSSILDKVDEVILCFLEIESKPEWSQGRRQSISTYPQSNMSCLGVTESEVFDGANWTAPASTEYGLEIIRPRGSISRYKDNFTQLRNVLEDKLKNYDNVYTHNPWGEYGHEEHVQVYEAVKALQKTFGFKLWFTNYFSNKTVALMNEYLPRLQLTSYSLPTNQATASKVMDLYKRNNCWTWYDNYSWPSYERFILDEKPKLKRDTFGKTLDLNFIKIGNPQNKVRNYSSPVRRAFRSIADKF